MKNKLTTHIDTYLAGIKTVVDQLDRKQIEAMVKLLVKLKARKGRLFLLGVGGSAANCSHAVNDFRKICKIETYSPVDNVSELTARTNDDGWNTIFSNWLVGSNLNKRDAVMVFSVGGGNLEKNVSANIVHALDFAKKNKSLILGIVGRDGGYTRKVADCCILIPTIDENLITPFAESFQSVLWHLIAFSKELRD